MRTHVLVHSKHENAKRRTVFHEIDARTIINPVKGRLPFRWSISTYRGCMHACTYCYARASHQFLDFGPGEDFEYEIVVKRNAPELLRREIGAPKMRHEPIAFGTVSDPYQPCETTYRLTRQLLDILLRSGNPVTITTKSTLITQDIELLTAFAQAQGCAVNVSLLTTDAEILRKVDPRAPGPAHRLRTIRTLARAGIPVGVFAGPVLPGLTDGEEQLEKLVHAVAGAGAAWIVGLPLRIGSGFAGPFLESVQADFPALLSRYQRHARSNGVPKGEAASVSARMDVLRNRYGLAAGGPDISSQPPEQLSLFFSNVNRVASRSGS